MILNKNLANGIRLFNALHAKRIEPRLTLYVCAGGGGGGGGGVHSALYLHAARAHDLLHKLRALLPHAQECETVLVSGPNNARVRLTDELVRHLPDNSTYRLERIEDNALLLSPTGN
ncbi:transcription factor CP2-like [Vanessa cardui]|uniref:transcription factor CP2-like n=1 Tax=Vanessa cardui TaxID=171605 RepID=UPI001F145535|nr:transcription factor CP2-like [Vanessa cardui]XP_046974835.1 transcription factor CP2-like [Vanessa cardui]XP_046974942.1 transcription factor CP2-like [Vanessa cardui]XP_046974944.1 transcription factor CP2-like [Vanessa cardui]